MSILIINKSLQIPLSELQFSSVRSGGPGGQNVNKVNSKVVLRWNLCQSTVLPEPVRQRLIQRWATRISHDGWLTLSSQRHRERRRNLSDCLEKLQTMVRSALEPVKPRRPTQPTRASRHRRQQDKQQLSHKKQSRRQTGWSE